MKYRSRLFFLNYILIKADFFENICFMQKDTDLSYELDSYLTELKSFQKGLFSFS